MQLRADEEIRASFESVAAALDAAVRLAHQQAGTAVRLLDSSNRSGFDHSGFLQFRFDVELEYRRGVDTIERAAVRVSVLEPIEIGEQRQIWISWVAERFHAGASIQLFEQKGKKLWPDAEPGDPAAIAREISDALAKMRALLD